jgi:hypothetical protein
MTDTPDHIKKLQHEIWMRKSPMERLKQFLLDNDDFYRVTDKIKSEINAKKNADINHTNPSKTS